MDTAKLPFYRRGEVVFISIVHVGDDPYDFHQYHISYGVSMLFTDRAIFRAVSKHKNRCSRTPAKARVKSSKDHRRKSGGLVVDVYRQRSGHAIQIVMKLKGAERWVVLPEERRLMKGWRLERARWREVRAMFGGKSILRH